jgi:hypothetical protein
MVFNATFNNISVYRGGQFIGGGKIECHKYLYMINVVPIAEKNKN